VSDRKARTGLGILAFFIAIGSVGPLIWQGDPTVADYTLRPQQPPSLQHWLGTDHLSRDIFLQMIDGTRPTLVVGAAIGILTTVIAVTVGLLAGSFGGVVDEVLMLLTNVVLVFPSFPLIIVVASWVHVTNDLPAIIVISLTSWAWGARVVRSQAMSIRQQEFVEAALVSGESWTRISFAEVMPNMISLIASSFIGTTIFGILASAGLQFLGFGNVNEINWFTMLYWAQNASALQTGAWWTFLPAGLCIALVGTALSLINYGIDEISNPRLRVIKKPRTQKVPRTTQSSATSTGVAR
jgi:peptide/nickel transport system permease protein